MYNLVNEYSQILNLKYETKSKVNKQNLMYSTRLLGEFTEVLLKLKAKCHANCYRVNRTMNYICINKILYISFKAILCDVQELIMVLCSGMSPGNVQGTIYGAMNWTRDGCVQDKHLKFYIFPLTPLLKIIIYNWQCWGITLGSVWRA